MADERYLNVTPQDVRNGLYLYRIEGIQPNKQGDSVPVIGRIVGESEAEVKGLALKIKVSPQRVQLLRKAEDLPKGIRGFSRAD